MSNVTFVDGDTSQVRARPKRMGRSARDADRQGAGAGPGPHGPADQGGNLVDPRPGDVGDQAGLRAERELHEPIGHLAGADRLEPEPGRDRQHGHAGQLCTVSRIRSWKWVARSVVHARPESATTRPAASLDAK
ncbi:MAG TPA: hypothetical protein VK923_06880 [Euzebyales bacterium]|nr:hypothetical protein [Euzebyales bacterium]